MTTTTPVAATPLPPLSPLSSLGLALQGAVDRRGPVVSQGAAVPTRQVRLEVSTSRSEVASSDDGFRHMDELRGATPALLQAWEQQRAAVDAARARGQQLDQHAVALETEASALQAEWDQLEPERLRAEAQVQLHRAPVDAAQADVQRAQAELDAAHQAMTQAGGIKKKKRRRRALAAAQAQIDAATHKLSLTQQRLAQVQPALDQALAAARPWIDAAERARLAWQAAATQAQAARAQAQSELETARALAKAEAAHEHVLVSHLQQRLEASKRGVDELKQQAAQKLARIFHQGRGSCADAGASGVAREGRSPMSVDIGEHLSASQPPLRRANPRSPDDPNWLSDSCHKTVSSEREKIHKRGRPDEISGLSTAALTNSQARLDEDAKEAHALLQTVQQLAAQDWARASSEREQAMVLQTQREGALRVAQSLEGNAQLLHVAYETAQHELDERQAQFNAAQSRWIDAQVAYAAADAAMDRAQSHVNAKRQLKAVEAAQPALDAARQARDASHEALLQAQDALDAALRQAEPLRQADLESSHRSLRARQDAQAQPQAVAQSAWAELAWARAQGTQAVVSAAQSGVIQNVRAQAGLHQAQGQGGMAQQLQARADTLEALAQQAQAAVQTTAAARATQDELAIEAGSARILAAHLRGQARSVAADYTQAQSEWTALAQSFAAATQAVQGTVGAFDEARAQVVALEQDAAVRFALSRVSNADQAHAQSQAKNDAVGFLRDWLQTQMAERKTTRKQLHLLDDLEQYKSADPAVQAARTALNAKTDPARDATREAVAAGQRAQAMRQLADLRSQALRNTQAELTRVDGEVAEASALAQAQAQVLHEAAQAQGGAAQRLQQALALEPVVGASPELAYAQTQMQLWAQTADEYQAYARQGALQLSQHAADLARENQARAQWAQRNAPVFERNLGLAAWVQSVSDAQDQRVADAADLHDQRVRYDQTYNKQKKRALVTRILSTVVGVALAAVSMGGAVALGTLLAGAELGAVGLASAGAVGGAVGNAASQGFNLAIGAQDTFIAENVGLAALGAGTTMGLLAGPATAVRNAIQNTLGASPALTQAVGKQTLGSLAEGLTAGAVVNPAVQGGFVALGLQDKFDWGQAVAVGLTAGSIGALNGRPGARSMVRNGGPARLSWGSFLDLGTQNALHEVGGRAFADVFANLFAAYVLNDKSKEYPHRYV